MTLKTVQEEIEKSLASSLKTRFLDENETDYKDFDIRDVERVQGNDLYFRLFIRARQGDLEKAYNMMVECLKWRKSYKINDITEEDLDAEVLANGILYYHKTDKKGRRILIFHGNKYAYRKERNKAKELEKIFAFYLERQHIEHLGKQLMVICDHEGADLSTMDLDFFKFLVNLFSNYYPHILDSFVVVDVPWRLSAVWKVIKSWLSSDMSVRFKFMNRPKLADFVDKSNLLASFGGQDSYEYTWSPVDHGLDDEEERSASSCDLGSSQEELRKKHFEDPIESHSMREEEHALPREEKRKNGYRSARKADMGGSMGTHVRHRFKDNQDSLKDKPPSDLNLENNFLIISPKDEIVFREVVHEHEIQETLMLENASASTIIFKIKTNSPANFRVRPSVGGLLPGTSAEVTLVLLLKDDSDQERQHYNKDKILILFSEISDEITSATDFSELWKTIPKIDTNERRLNCRVLDVNGLEKRPKTIDDVIEMSLELRQQLSQLHTQVNKVSNSLSQIKQNLQKQNFMLIAMLALIFLACLIFWFR